MTGVVLWLSFPKNLLYVDKYRVSQIDVMVWLCIGLVN